MKITKRQEGGVVILDLDGKIVLGEGDETLRRSVRQVVADGHRKVVLNLARVPYVDSAGLGELVRCHTRVAQAGGAIGLLHLTKRMQDLLQITKLVTVFDTFESEESAIASF